MVAVVGLQRDEKVRKVVVVPEITYHPDNLLKLGYRLIVGERPDAAHGKDGRPSADLKTMNAIVTRRVKAVGNVDPGSGVRLATIGCRCARAEAGGECPRSRQFLP